MKVWGGFEKVLSRARFTQHSCHTDPLRLAVDVLRYVRYQSHTCIALALPSTKRSYISPYSDYHSTLFIIIGHGF